MSNLLPQQVCILKFPGGTLSSSKGLSLPRLLMWPAAAGTTPVSHPGYTCFLSETDLNTQMNMFPEKYHIAVVVDPVNIDIKAFSAIDGEAREKMIFIVE